MTTTERAAAVKQQLYRLYDVDGELLYIGISYSAIARYAQHKTSQPWAADVSRIEIETHECGRREIEEIERNAIRGERPRHNVTHNAPKGVANSPILPAEFDASAFLVANSWTESLTACCEALDAFARDLDFSERSGYPTPTRADMLEVINGVTRSLVYGDCCDKCGDIRYPLALKYDSPKWVRCGYVCIPCQNQWSCGWTADLAVLGSI